jgi:hypothetical protein
VPGVYLIADGDPNNADPTGASSGYIGLSNWETATPDADCDGVDEAANGGTNSGGCVTVNHPVNGTPLLALPIPLLVGGSATGPYDGSSRDGLSVP